MDLVDTDGFVYVNIKKGMYGINQLNRISFVCLVKLLNPYGYCRLCSNPIIWCHKTLPTTFTLFVDKFVIKYTNSDHDHHLVNTLQKYYKIYINWEGKNYCGFTLDWNYEKTYFYVAMPGYVAREFHNFQQPRPKQPYHDVHD